MFMSAVYGSLAINDMTLEDEQVFTCSFHHSEEYVATVQLKMKSKYTQLIMTPLKG